MTSSFPSLGRALRRTTWASPLGVTAALAVASVLAGAASWASRPEAWELGAAIPITAALAWVGLSAPALAPAAVLLGSFLAARARLRSGAVDACDLLGLGPTDRWRAVAPVWLLAAALGGVWTNFAEPMAWRTTLQIRDAVARPTRVAVLDDGLVMRDGDTLRIHHRDARATVLGFSPDNPTAGPAHVVTEAGAWTARSVRRRLLDAPTSPRLPPLAQTPGRLWGDASPRARALLHRRASLPVLLMLLSFVGTVAGGRGTARRPDRTGPAVLAVLLATLALARLGDQLAVAPALVGWAPLAPAAIAAVLWRRHA